MNKTRLLVLAVVAGLILAFFVFDLGQYLNLEYIKTQQANIDAYYQANPIRSIVVFFILYVVMAALSVPGAVWATLAAGAIFGTLLGTVLVSFASSIGATIAFLVARFLLRDWVAGKFKQRLEAIDKGVRREGAYYLFTLRMVPVFPFWLINLLMGLTSIRTGVFYLVSQIGMLPATVVYVNAGSQLAQIESAAGILSPAVIFSLCLLGVLPLVTKKAVDLVTARQVYKPYTRPKRFDRNLVVIGAGSAGLVAAYVAAAVKAKVTLIEKHKMGGDCLNTGCVPSKALLRSARFVSHVSRATEFGIGAARAEVDFAQVMDRVHRVIRTIEPHDSVARYTDLGVECLPGDAKITSPFHVEIDGTRLSTRNIVIAAGAGPAVPPIPGIEEIEYWTSDNLWQMREQPRRLAVLGGGPIGSELSQAFARLGSQVTQIEMLPRLLTAEDPEVSEMVRRRFVSEGIEVLLEHKAKAFERQSDRDIVICEHDGKEVPVEFDALLVAVGRKPRTGGYGLEELGIETSRSGTIEVNDYLQTRYPNIYACGDVAGPYQFTHTAAHQAWYAAVNALFGGLRKFRVDYSVIPWATFTEPEVARVGLNETQAAEQGVDYEVTRYGIDDLDRAIADEEAHGLVKVLTVPGSDRILGVTIVGEHAGDLIAEYVLAMKHKLGLNKILRTIHIYPTLAEANKFAAGEWRRAHAPERLLGWVQRYHAWMRG